MKKNSEGYQLKKLERMDQLVEKIEFIKEHSETSKTIFAKLESNTKALERKLIMKLSREESPLKKSLNFLFTKHHN